MFVISHPLAIYRYHIIHKFSMKKKNLYYTLKHIVLHKGLSIF